MLVLTRKLGQEVHIGQDVSVRISNIGAGRVRLAIDAPNDVKVLRGELRAMERDSDKDCRD